MTNNAAYGSLPFSEQIAFFQRKMNLPTDSYADIFGAEHDWAFVVAGANRDNMVADLRAAVEKGIIDGTPLEEFRKDFALIVEKYGWDYNGGFAWRTRIIFDTNLRSSYMAGRYQQLYALRETMPYWEYIHSDAVEDPRELHLSWDGLILRWDDPWWQYYFPINAYGCQCGVIARSEDDLKRMGRTPDTAPPIEFELREIGKNSPNGPRVVSVPKGLDPGFDHIPGLSRINSQVPPPASHSPIDSALPSSDNLPSSHSVDPLPPARDMAPDNVLSTGLSERDYAERFLSEFGATLDNPVIFNDVVGEPRAIGSELFRSRKTGEIAITHRGNEQYLLLLANALKFPDEIWTHVEWYAATQQANVLRRYIARFNVEGIAVPVVAVFEVGANGWSGITSIVSDAPEYLDSLRQGVRVYQRLGE